MAPRPSAFQRWTTEPRPAAHLRLSAAYCGDGDRIVCRETDEHSDRLLFYKEPTPEAIGALGAATSCDGAPHGAGLRAQMRDATKLPAQLGAALAGPPAPPRCPPAGRTQAPPRRRLTAQLMRAPKQAGWSRTWGGCPSSS